MPDKIINRLSTERARQVRTGKDGAIYNSMGNLLASMESYNSQINFVNAKHQELGNNQVLEANTGYEVTLKFTETVVEDIQFVEDVNLYQNEGIVPNWTFQGVICGANGSEDRTIYPNCIPSGTLDLQNVSSGDVIKRAWSVYVNGRVRKQGTLTAD